MSSHAAALRALSRARPLPIRRGWPERIRTIYAHAERRLLTCLAAYLIGLAVATWWTVCEPSAFVYVLAVWLLAGAQALSIGAWIGLDVHRRRSRHDRSGLVAVAGWRIVGSISEIDPDLLLAVSLLSNLFDHAEITGIPVRGHRRRTRTTYTVSLRILAREWGRGSGVSGRRADLLLARLCDEFSVVRRVPVGTATAFRLADESIGSALARLEQATGTKLIAWSMGRDPGWDGARSPTK
jgi:hypothetical protein